MKPRTLAVLAFLTIAGWTTAAGAEERPFRFRCGLSGALALWIAPADFAFEGAVDCGLRWPIFSVALELRGSPPAGANLPLQPLPGEKPPYSGWNLPLLPISTSRFAAAAVPCVHWELSERWHKPTLLGCAVVQGGAMFGTTDVVGLVNDDGTPASVGTLPYFAAGARVAFEIDIISDRLSARIASDYLGVLSRPLFTIDDRTLYQTAPFSMAIGGGLGVFF
jgi:hypothetical protein